MALIAVTGATGFIGRHLVRELPKRGYQVRVLLRRPSAEAMDAPSAMIANLADPKAMAAALSGVNALIHSSAVGADVSGVPEDDYRVLNTQATARLARAAQQARVGRFVFLSSIRAQSGPTVDTVLTEDMEPQPSDAYGRSKLEAERALAGLDIDWVALRLVLVYGRGMKGNLARLERLARSPYPLPLGGLTGRRSLVSVDHLVDAVQTVLPFPGPLRRPLIVADTEPLTIAEMVAAMRKGLGRRPGLVKTPASLLAMAARIAGGPEFARSLTGSLVADSSTLMRLGWTPRTSTAAGLEALMRDSRS
jgi:nucleoside-diphosphate-sugar epimerase